MLNLTSNELKLAAKSRGIKDYENETEDALIKILSETKTKASLSNNGFVGKSIINQVEIKILKLFFMETQPILSMKIN